MCVCAVCLCINTGKIDGIAMAMTINSALFFRYNFYCSWWPELRRRYDHLSNIYYCNQKFWGINNGALGYSVALRTTFFSSFFSFLWSPTINSFTLIHVVNTWDAYCANACACAHSHIILLILMYIAARSLIKIQLKLTFKLKKLIRNDSARYMYIYS